MFVMLGLVSYGMVGCIRASLPQTADDAADAGTSDGGTPPACTIGSSTAETVTISSNDTDNSVWCVKSGGTLTLSGLSANQVTIIKTGDPIPVRLVPPDGGSTFGAPSNGIYKVRIDTPDGGNGSETKNGTLEVGSGGNQDPGQR